MSAGKSGDLIRLDISGLNREAAGVGRLDGLAVFVPGALPGEKVTARITNRKKNYALARLAEIIKPAPERVKPDCPVYGQCGGCALRHLSYQAELEFKRDTVQQALRRIGGVDVEVPPPLAGLPEYYRNRAVLHVAQNNGMSIGFFNHLTHRICAVEKCLLLRRELNELLALLREVLPRHADALPQLRNLVLRCNGDGTELLLTLVGECQLSAAEDLAAALMRREPRLASVWVNTGPPLYGIYGGEWRRLAGAEQLNERIGPLRLRLSPASFLQVNCQLILPLYRLARDFAGISRHERAFDLYSGVGSIALYLAPDSERVCGIENYAPAVADAKENAVLNGIDNCRFIAGAAEDSLPQLAGSGERADVLVLDPPRAGCAKRVVDAIITMRPRRIVYVSCDPATLARDVRLLAAAGYQATKVQPVDMFPRTPHVETVVLMSRVKE